jgi:hypothetical protein
MTKQTFSVTNVRPLHDGAFLGYGPNFEVVVEFPEGYDHLGANEEDPIDDAVVAYLNKEGWDCNGASYTAYDVDNGIGQERHVLKMGG